jgi:hypothetical protein
MKRRLVKLPGTPETWVDPRSVVVVRIETGGDEPVVVIHTDEGFAVGIAPLRQQVEDLLDGVIAAVKKGR